MNIEKINILKNKLLFINPAGSHSVFRGLQYFFDQYFDFHIYNHGTSEKQFGKFHSLIPSKLIHIFKNFIAFYNGKDLNINPKDTIIIGDIFTNTLCYTLRSNKILYYSEYFNFWKNTLKYLLFYLIGFCFFYRKKFIVPTQLAEKTFLNLSSKVLYFPPVYYGKITENLHIESDIVELLFVGRMSQKFKNTDFLISNVLSLPEHLKVRLTLVGETFDCENLKSENLHRLGNRVRYLGSKSSDELVDIYQNSDIFILPSNSDPIGAVVLEAMAHGCAMLLSDTVGASCFIENDENGTIFKTNDEDDFKEKLGTMIKSRELLEAYKNKSIKLVRENFWYGNEKLLQKKYETFTDFLNT